MKTASYYTERGPNGWQVIRAGEPLSTTFSTRKQADRALFLVMEAESRILREQAERATQDA